MIAAGAALALFVGFLLLAAFSLLSGLETPEQRRSEFYNWEERDWA